MTVLTGSGGNQGGRMTGREAGVLAVMAATGEELAYERGAGAAYLGTTRLSARLVFSLIRHMWVSFDSEVRGVERYYVNKIGRNALLEHWGIDLRRR